MVPVGSAGGRRRRSSRSGRRSSAAWSRGLPPGVGLVALEGRRRPEVGDAARVHDVRRRRRVVLLEVLLGVGVQQRVRLVRVGLDLEVVVVQGDDLLVEAEEEDAAGADALRRARRGRVGQLRRFHDGEERLRARRVRAARPQRAEHGGDGDHGRREGEEGQVGPRPVRVGDGAVLQLCRVAGVALRGAEEREELVDGRVDRRRVEVPAERRHQLQLHEADVRGLEQPARERDEVRRPERPLLLDLGREEDGRRRRELQVHAAAGAPAQVAVEVVRRHRDRLGLHVEGVAELVEPRDDLQAPVDDHAVLLHGLDVVRPGRVGRLAEGEDLKPSCRRGSVRAARGGDEQGRVALTWTKGGGSGEHRRRRRRAVVFHLLGGELHKKLAQRVPCGRR
mmetsp:Transcript_846/g.2837  ORF Transcript_846/g.2837 Transcript_846/m.2837 type:complete len:394 (+) Transcript_846:188-1369(+)